MTTVPDGWMSTATVAADADVCRNYVGELAARWHWRYVVAMHGRRFYNPADVTEWLARRDAPPTIDDTPEQRLALAVTDYRLALEMTRAALRLGRTDDALTHLDDVLN